MASIEVMKERARIAGRFNLSARRNPEHRALVTLAAQRAGGECHVIPAAPGEKVADVFRRSRNIAGESAVIIVTEINGTLYAQIIQAERVRNLGQDSRGVTTVASASGVTQPETAHEDLTIGTFLQVRTDDPERLSCPRKRPELGAGSCTERAGNSLSHCLEKSPEEPR